MKAAFFPDTYRKENPYLDLLESSLQEAGVEVSTLPIDEPYRNWLVKNREQIDVLHFHWLNPMYIRSSFAQTGIALVKFAWRLTQARRLGYRIVWTMHNLWPHERRYPILDTIAQRMMLRAAHAVIVHCNQARQSLKDVFGQRKNIYVIPIGNYPRLSDKEVDPIEVKQNLGMNPQQFMFFTFGQIRRYKGLENLIEAFQDIKASQVTLLIAGNASSPELAKEITRRAATDIRIHLKIGWIPNQILHAYLISAETVVLPFRNLTTSSTAMLSFSYGKPVIAPHLGCLPELIDDQTGFLYNPQEAQGLATTLQKCLDSREELAKMGQRAYKKALSYSWTKIGEMTANVYRGIATVG